MVDATPTLEERRARRAEKRAKDRELTLLRAAKMHKARVSSKAGEGFGAAAALPALNIGCSGWFYWYLKARSIQRRCQ